MKQKSLDHQKVLSFLKEHYLTVIATTDLLNPYPESALIAFAENDNLELFFQTSQYSRKAKNIKNNPDIAFVIGLDIHDLKTLQYQGRATRLTKQDEIESCKQRFIAKNSPTAKPEYLEHPDSIFFHVKPRWIGFSDYSQGRPLVIEMKKFR